MTDNDFKYVDELRDVINRQKAESEELQMTLLGVMHHVDKWLEGDELEQNEVVRAQTMREKTLQIVEGQQAEIEELQAKKLSREQDRDYWLVQTRMAREKVKNAKSEAIKEFAERLENILYPYKDVNFSAEDIQGYCYDIIEEMTEEIQNDR